MLRADETYRGTVTGGKFFQSFTKGTPGYQVNMECDDGDCSYTIWLTKKNEDRVRQDFEVLGVDVAQMGSRSFIEHELPRLIAGKEIAFGTRAETYKQKTEVKVIWIGKPKAADEGSLLAEVAGFFGGPASPEPTSQGIPDDDDIPF